MTRVSTRSETKIIRFLWVFFEKAISEKRLTVENGKLEIKTVLMRHPLQISWDLSETEDRRQ